MQGMDTQEQWDDFQQRHQPQQGQQGQQHGQQGFGAPGGPGSSGPITTSSSGGGLGDLFSDFGFRKSLTEQLASIAFLVAVVWQGL